MMQRASVRTADDDRQAAGQARQPRPGQLGTAFWRVWIANLASCAGDGIRIGALPLLAASLDFAPGAVAAVWFAGGLPFVLVGPFAGVLSDRWRDRRLVMWTSDAVAFAGGLAFALLVATGHASIAVLIGFNFAVGMGPVGSAGGGLTGELLGLRAPLIASAAVFGGGLVLALLFVSAHKIDDAVAATRRDQPVGAFPD
ncbi:MAG: MFS transporter [Trebonia sp.]